MENGDLVMIVFSTQTKFVVRDMNCEKNTISYNISYSWICPYQRIYARVYKVHLDVPCMRECR